MTTPDRDQSPRPRDQHPGSEALDRASLLRAAADDELDPGELGTLSAMLDQHPDDADRILFERDLRRACQRVFSGDDVSAPEALRHRVASLAGAERESVQAGALATRHAAASRPSMPRARRRSPLRWFAGALAAVMLVAIGLQLSTIWRAPTFAESPDRARLALAQFVGSEHRRCAIDERALKRKMTELSLADTPARFRRLLGAELSVANVEDAGYRFLGAGRCVVPGSGASVHLVFSDASASHAAPLADPTCDPSRLSLFIQKDTGELPIVPETTYRLDVVDGGPLVAVWARGGLVYYLVTETHAAEDAVLAHLGLTAASRPF